MPSPRWAVAATLVLGFTTVRIGTEKAPALEDMLKAGADYLVQYSKQLSAIVAEEAYTQYETSSGKMSVPRRLGADYVLVGLGNGGVAGFRDVYSIDAKPLHAREDKLVGLLKKLSPGAL